MNYCFCSNEVGLVTSLEDVLISSFLLGAVPASDWIETAMFDMSFSCPVTLPSSLLIRSLRAAVSSINLLVKLREVSRPEALGRLCAYSELGYD